MANKTVSAGVILTDGANLLLCHVTGAHHYDLPKGKMDPGESELQAAVRELKEETGLVVDPGTLQPLGRYAYKKTKDLSLWLHRVDTMPDPATLVCHSRFDDGRGVMRTEMDGFDIVPWAAVKGYVVPDMFVVLKQVHKHIVQQA